MKKKITAIFIVASVLIAMVFGVLWQQALHDDTRLLRLAQAEAREACTRFSDFQEKGDESDYWGGVASFRSFQQTYYLLVEGTNKATNYTFCNEVYGCLLLSPEKSQLHISEIIRVMGILARNVQDENGYIGMADLRNRMRE